MRACIHSAENGSVMIIPREKDLVRLYIQLAQPEKGKRPKRSDITPEKLMASAQSIFAPYTLEIPKIEWVCRFTSMWHMIILLMIESFIGFPSQSTLVTKLDNVLRIIGHGTIEFSLLVMLAILTLPKLVKE